MNITIKESKNIIGRTCVGSSKTLLITEGVNFTLHRSQDQLQAACNTISFTYRGICVHFDNKMS